MNSLSITQLARFSGIKPHTIRMWEHRYSAFKPHRSKGNTRSYDGAQLRRLLNIVSLMESNYKISELGFMPDEKLFALLKKEEEETVPGNTNYFISQLIAAGMEYDEPAFEKMLAHCILRYGLKNTYAKIISPLLERIGLMWAADALPPANEHFISNLIRQKLYTSIDSLPQSKQRSDTWLLFLPENEFHEIGLLMANYLLRLSGKTTIYLGANVPEKSLFQALKATKAKNLLLLLTHNDEPEDVQKHLTEIEKKTQGTKLHVAGNPKLLARLKDKKTIIKLSSIEDLEKQL